VRLPGALKMAVNLSPSQFRSERLVPTVIHALAASGLAAERLELEITESVLLQDSAANIKLLHELRDLGVRICMDDFGTGYSSLSYLRSFPFDKIKIDRSFVSDLSADPDAGAIVKAVTGLGQSLGMTTTAEGVETSEQLELLRAEGCTEAQGYLISRPVRCEDLLDLLDAKDGSFADLAARGQLRNCPAQGCGGRPDSRVGKAAALSALTSGTSPPRQPTSGGTCTGHWPSNLSRRLRRHPGI
jgi:EAL domain-containing protein (putative c-di-GMP-specific phosphodiesterase class I)